MSRIASPAPRLKQHGGRSGDRAGEPVGKEPRCHFLHGKVFVESRRETPSAHNIRRRANRVNVSFLVNYNKLTVFLKVKSLPVIKINNCIFMGNKGTLHAAFPGMTPGDLLK
jgi:hypothetical protein